MLGRKNKWNQIFGRDLLYAQLAERFGPYNEWEGPYPKGKKRHYQAFIYNFALAITILSGDKTSPGAVQTQINFALTSQDSVSGSHTSIYILNIASAYKAGFLTDKNFPSVVLAERKIDNSK